MKDLSRLETPRKDEDRTYSIRPHSGLREGSADPASLDELATSDVILGNLLRHYFKTKIVADFGRHLGRIAGDQAYKMAAGFLEARERHLKEKADEGHEDGQAVSNK